MIFPGSREPDACSRVVHVGIPTRRKPSHNSESARHTRSQRRDARLAVRPCPAGPLGRTRFVVWPMALALTSHTVAPPLGSARYGGRPRPSITHTFGDQLGSVRGTKSKIEDGSDLGTSLRQVTSVADFWKRLRFGPQLVPEFPHSARPSARRQPPWQESVDG